MREINKSKDSFLILLLYPILTIFPFSVAASTIDQDSLHYWIEEGFRIWDDQDGAAMEVVIQKLRSIQESNIYEKSNGYADLFEAEYYRRSDIQKCIALSKQAYNYFIQTEHIYETARSLLLLGIGLSNSGDADAGGAR